ncbi:hypothetical protein FAUST_10787 [Fusarium austroamericanum]|uniref:Uncharacterized protein n=1 Tax=Fusarium austroamericanum TaxID=282268 RepID=A0AAN5Z0F3_FUSAU|nr:hypothetical protein FAUST_10787 [Fusarium austroamericanum]
MRSSTLFKVVLSAFATSVAAAVSSQPVSLYAYGPGVDGHQLFSAGVTVLNDDKCQVSPNTTALSGQVRPDWHNGTLVAPGPSISSRTVKIVNDTIDTSDYISTFMLYGQFFMGQENGQMLSLWYRQPTNIKGLYTVGWNATDSDTSDEFVPIVLKMTAPSNPTL